MPLFLGVLLQSLMSGIGTNLGQLASGVAQAETDLSESALGTAIGKAGTALSESNLGTAVGQAASAEQDTDKSSSSISDAVLAQQDLDNTRMMSNTTAMSRAATGQSSVPLSMNRRPAPYPTDDFGLGLGEDETFGFGPR